MERWTTKSPSEIAALRTELVAMEGRLGNRITALEGLLKAAIAALEGRMNTRISELEVGLIRWSVGTIIATVSVVVALMKLLA